MPILRQLLICTLLPCLAFVGHAQHSTWKSLRDGKITLNYPPTWHMTKETVRDRTRTTLTPDSMQHLTLRMIEIVDIPVGSDYPFAALKSHFPSIIKLVSETRIKITREEETTFKDHKTMYAEYIRNGLPGKLYGIVAVPDIYLINVFTRRYTTVPDAALERDEKIILNSITFDQ
jgi:hypothetical protein